MNKIVQYFILSMCLIFGIQVGYSQSVFTVTSASRAVREHGLTEVVGEVSLISINNTGTIKSGSYIDVTYSAPITNNSSISTNNISRTNNLSCFGSVNFVSDCTNNSKVNVSLSGTNIVRISFTNDVTLNSLSERITVFGIRVNANSAVGVGTITATLSGASSLPVTNSITFTDTQKQVAVINPELSVTYNNVNEPIKYLQTCNFPNVISQTFNVTVDELFPSTLTSITQESVLSNYLPATNGSSIRVVLTNVPAGLTVSTPSFINSTDLNNNIITTNMIGAVTPSQDQTVTNAPMIFDFSVLSSDVTKMERLNILFSIRATSNSSSSIISINPVGQSTNIQGTISLGPITTSDAIIPRFSSNLSNPTTIVNITDCNTRLLFPWVATVGDSETGIAIVNTSLDDEAFGTGPSNGASSQNGSCKLTGYSATGGPPVSYTTANINAGATFVIGLSNITTFNNFSGYVLVVCNFQNAHGYALITNGKNNIGGPTISDGYLATVIPYGSRPANGLFESLGF